MSEPARKGGEWRSEDDGDGDIFVKNDDGVVASVFGDEQQALDDARLMAAAPELLAACQVFLNSCSVVAPKAAWDAMQYAVDKATNGGG